MVAVAIAWVEGFPKHISCRLVHTPLLKGRASEPRPLRYEIRSNRLNSHCTSIISAKRTANELSTRLGECRLGD